MTTTETLPLAPDALPTLTELDRLSRPALVALYEQLLRRPPPRNAGPRFLIGNCAWAIQAVQRGRDPLALRRELLEALKARFGGGAGQSPIRYKPGSRLIREWQGEVHEVVVLEKGFRWREKTFQSLSAIATAITGARWSGPRFFGLKTEPTMNGRRRERLEREGRYHGK